ncbi:MAG: glutathione S-transferase N-terminal domain-containing protein [Pseudomonadales bacterium]|jgi:glutathione S-transferase|nr:glutathione S-transferase N-terminal domain-containing protein [Pseudomonadales bacterium]
MSADRSGTSSLDLAGSLAVTAARFGTGIAAQRRRERPEWLFVLYEFEACPYCRIVREVLTELDLDAEIRPCPKGGERFRPALLERGGKAQFPYLIDPNTQIELYESADIVRHLFETYGDGVPLHWRLGPLQQLGSQLAGAFRPLAGRRARPSRAPARPLELYSFEGSPFARLVRERLCELEIPWILRSTGRTQPSDWVPPGLRDRFAIEARPESDNRRALLARAGRLTIPYLVDPNTGEEMGESGAIVDYLERSYAL